MCFVPHTPPPFILDPEISLLFDLVPLKTRKWFLKLWITMPVEWWCLKTATTNVSSQRSQKATWVWARATPNWMLVGMLNIETIFHISFHQHRGHCPAYHFLIMQIGRNLYHLRCSSIWQRQTVHLMGQRHKANWRVLLVYLTSVYCTVVESETYKSERWDWRKFGSVIWCADAYLWTWWCNDMWRVNERIQLCESKLKLSCKNCLCDENMNKTEIRYNLNNDYKPQQSAVPDRKSVV